MKAILGKHITFQGTIPLPLRKALGKLSSENQALLTRGLAYPIGCLDFIKEDIEIEDNRRKIPAKLYKLKTKLDRFQKIAAKSMILKEHGYLVAPPGSGKTIVMLQIAQLLQMRTLIISHRVELAKQLASKAARELGVVSGIVAGGERIEGIEITVAIAQAIARRPLKDGYGLLLMDECSHLPTQTMVRILTQYSAKYKYGVTASLARTDEGKELFPFLLGNYTIEVPISEALGRVNLPDIVKVETGLSGALQEFCSKNCNNFNDCQFSPGKSLCGSLYFRMFSFLNGWIDKEKRNNLIVEHAKRLYEKDFEFIAILTNRKKHAEHIAALALQAGLSVHTCIGKIKKGSLQVFKMFGGVLVGTESLLSEGIDCPELDVLQLASPAGGKSRVLQRIGRLMRGEGTKIVLDYVDDDPLSRIMWFARNNSYKKLRLRYRKLDEI